MLPLAGSGGPPKELVRQLRHAVSTVLCETMAMTLPWTLSNQFKIGVGTALQLTVTGVGPVSEDPSRLSAAKHPRC